MKKNKGGGGGGGANWMDTYGDMVTLLMCFFILLYSMSSVDQEKYAALAESFNPDARDDVTELPENPGPATDTVAESTPEQAEKDMEQLYEDLVDFFIEENMGSNVSISKGSGYVFISFHDALFFAGNSYTISDEGMDILDRVSESIGAVSNSVNVIEVLGHTARADSEQANIVSTDRFLASNRATAVTIYLQQLGFIDPSRLVSIGYGEWRPMGDNSISEEQAANRRVELVISGITDENANADDIDSYYNMLEEATPADDVDLSAPSEGESAEESTAEEDTAASETESEDAPASEEPEENSAQENDTQGAQVEGADGNDETENAPPVDATDDAAE